MIKKLLSIFIIFAVIFSVSSCKDTNKDTKKSDEAPEVSDVKYNKTIQLYQLMLVLYKPPTDEINEWEDYIERKHGLPVELEFIDFTNLYWKHGSLKLDSKTGVHTETLNSSEKLEGFVYFYHMYYLSNLIAEGLIAPVNDYINKMPEYSSLNPVILAAHTDYQGNIWAFPGRWTTSLKHRIYNKEWLDGWGTTAPVDVWEFMEYGRHLSDIEDKNIYAMQYDYQSALSDFEDIFKAFGCYSSDSSPIGYNPHTGLYENIILKEEFKEVVNYVNRLKDENLICLRTNNSTESEYEIASIMSYGGVPEYFGDVSFGSYMTGLYDTKLIKIRGGVGGLAMLRDTENADLMVSRLLSVTTDPVGRLDFLLGREDYNYTFKNGYINSITRDENNNSRYRIGISFGETDGGDTVQVLRDGEVTRIPSIERFSRIAEVRMKVDASLMDSDLVYYEQSRSYRAELVSKLNAIIGPYTEDLFRSILNGGSVDSAIEHFKYLCDSFGITDELAVYNKYIKEQMQ